MSTLRNTDEFNRVDDNEAYVIHTRKGTRIRSDDNPILFIAGEDAKYKFLLMSAFILDGNQLNLLIMSMNKMITPKFSLLLECSDKNNAPIFTREVLLCKHGSQVVSGQNFYAEIDIPDHLASITKQLSLKIVIGGTPTPFTLWSSDMDSISIIDNAELLLQFENLVVKKKTNLLATLRDKFLRR